MRPKWDNLFWYQQAPAEDEDQLENNTTKGFLKVLQESDDRLTTEFLQLLNLDFEDATFEYEAQIQLNQIPAVEYPPHLVGLSYDNQNVAREVSPQPGEGRLMGSSRWNRIRLQRQLPSRSRQGAPPWSQFKWQGIAVDLV